LGEQKHFDFIDGRQVELPDDLGQNLQIDAVGSGWKGLMAFVLIAAPDPILEFPNSSVFCSADFGRRSAAYDLGQSAEH
jgi:hypothetical protein